MSDIRFEGLLQKLGVSKKKVYFDFVSANIVIYIDVMVSLLYLYVVYIYRDIIA